MSIKKILALLMALVMMMSFAACSNTDSDDDDSGSSGKKKDTIVGEWKGELELGGIMELAFSSMGADYFDFDDLSLAMIMVFEDDGSFSLEADEDDVQDFIDAVVDIVVDGYEVMMEEEGSSWEDLGMTEKEFREAMEDEYDEDMVEELTDSFAGTGYYVIIDDRIYTAEDEDDLENAEEDADEYMEFKLEGDKLTIKDIVSDGESIEEVIPGIMPWKFTRK